MSDERCMNSFWPFVYQDEIMGLFISVASYA